MLYVLIVLFIILGVLLIGVNAFNKVRKTFKSELTNILDSTNYRKWIIGGMIGSGKTTFAHSLSKMLKIQHIEIDNYESKEDILNTIDKYEDNGWIAEANPWQIPEELSASAEVVIFLDYNNLVNYLRLLKRGLREWSSKKYTLSNFKKLIIYYTILDLGKIVFFHGKANRAGWRKDGLLKNLDSSKVRKIRCISPAELKLLENLIFNNCNHLKTEV